jgi:hypothetical protein
LPRATGYEAGFCIRRFDRVAFSAAFWLLYLDSELVFVGDEGITEASAATKRLGFELFTRVKLLDRRWLRGDITNMTDGFRGSGDAVPLAPRFTARGDADARLPFGHVTGLSRRKAVPDRGSEREYRAVCRRRPDDTLPPALQGWARISMPFLMFQSLLNTEYKQAQFFFESRLANEPAPVADAHFTPRAPFGVLGGPGLIL